MFASGIVAAEETNSIRFLVVDQNNQPVENAVVELVSSDHSHPALEPARMDQINKSFAPHVLTITKGQSVSFPNSDQIRHHVYSFSPPKPFEIRLYAGTPGDPVPFDKTGVVVLGCNIHDHMVGYIYIGETGYTGISDQNGETDIQAPMEFDSVRLWHEQLSLDGQTRLLLKKSQLKTETSKDGQSIYRLQLPVVIKTPAQKTENSKDVRNKFMKFGSP
ncbi:hypothetical protein BTA51_22720 [Hahella sp. CCB-MM4]|nr:hypothetical protein BTA51_22720 [Hahella sp. CCB-MM4]